MSADSKSENRGKMKRGKNSKVSGFRHSSPANNCNDLWNITKPAFKKEYRIGEVLMDAEKEQADNLCIIMVRSCASPETNFVQSNTVAALRVPSQFSTILFRSGRYEEKGQERVSKRVSKESYERNDRIKPWLLLKNVVYRCSILSEAFLKIVSFRCVIIFLDETENLCKCRKFKKRGTA